MLWSLVVFNSLPMVGFQLQWPTFATLLMFPVLQTNVAASPRPRVRS